jgi:hypothetical protein
MSMKNSNNTIGNRTRDIRACSAVPQPTTPPRSVYVGWYNKWKVVRISSFTSLLELWKLPSLNLTKPTLTRPELPYRIGRKSEKKIISHWYYVTNRRTGRRTWSSANILWYDNFVRDALVGLRLSASLRMPCNIIGIAYLINSSILTSGHHLIHSSSISGHAGLNTLQEKDEIQRTSTEIHSFRATAVTALWVLNIK